MNERGNDSLDDRIDAALRAMVVPDDRPVDLRARVLAAIDVGQQARRGARGRARRAAFPDFRLLPRPALALALAAVLAVVAVAVWPALRHERAPLVSNRSALTRPITPLPPAGPHTTAPFEGAGPAAAGPSAGAGRVATSTIALARNEDRLPAGRSQPWSALPRLAPPEPIALEPIGEPPMRVAQLEVERLSIDPLEMDALDGSEEE